VTDKTKKADAVDASSAAAEETDDEQQRSDADDERRQPVQWLVVSVRPVCVQWLVSRCRLRAVSRAAGGG